jgi:Ala-tRNA(Pro) deacylase
VNPLDCLDEKNIAYTVFDHEAVYTVEEAKTLTNHIPGLHCKNLFLRNRNGKQHYLLVLEEDRVVDLKELSDLIGCSNLSFASSERLYKYLKLKPGSVSPLGLVNDETRHVKVFFDKQVYESEFSAFHPNINTRTIVVNTQELFKFIDELGYQIQMI